jgi:hypothetical protein
MPSAAEALNSKPPLGATLAQGVQSLSMDQALLFSLYRKYIFPLDGMNYWIRVPSSPTPVTTPGIQATPGLATATVQDGEAIQVSPGDPLAHFIVGGTIFNPLSAVDQGLSNAESLFVDFTGPAYSHITATTSEIEPGEYIDIPANCTTAAWVCAASGGHKFSCVLRKTVPSVTMSTDVEVKGSFHYATTTEQNEEATVDVNEVIFTSLSEIQQFNNIGPDFLYLCHFDALTFAFDSRARLYEQADLYHYRGHALKSKHQTQIIDNPANFNPTLSVSNSLPIWLYMQIYVPPYPGFVCPFVLYPSYLVDDNLPPPFGAVHIEDTETLAMNSYLGPTLQSSQLCKEKVKITLFGVDNATAITFMNFVAQYSRDWMYLGLSESPAIHDEKDTQPEMKILAVRKSIEFDINYNQMVSRNIARQLIEHAKVKFFDPHWFVDAA